jgi:hypothetical protein
MRPLLKPARWLPWLLTILLLGGSVMLQDELIYRRRQEPSRFRDSLYLPDSRYVKFVSLGYDYFVADFLWLRMIQSFAAGWSRPENKEQVRGYFDVITDLDPHYLDAYHFAIMALGEQKTDKDEYDRMVLETVDKAALYNPRDYLIPYDGAFHAWYTMKNADLAKYYVHLTMKDPEHPTFIDRWPTYFDLESGRYRAAYEKYMRDYAKALFQGDEVVKEILMHSLQRSVSLWICDAIKTRASEWRNTHDRYPTVPELEQAGAFKDVELPNWPYIQNVFDQAAKQGVNLTADETRMQQFIANGLTRWNRVPPSPYDDLSPRFKGYVIWPGLPETHESFVLTQLQAVNKMQGAVNEIQGGASMFKLRNNGRAPQDLHEFAANLADQPDAFGGRFTWDPKTEKAGCTSVPDIEELNLPDL